MNLPHRAMNAAAGVPRPTMAEPQPELSCGVTNGMHVTAILIEPDDFQPQFA